MSEFRIEKDSMGEVKVPNEMFFGASTQRAVDNFKVSSHFIHKEMIRAVILLKKSAALANGELKTLSSENVKGIVYACDKILGDFDTWVKHFPIDLFQTGSGTSTNMNANEIIANIANIKMAGQEAFGSGKPIHPNDHVNWGQSSNCIMPSSISVSNRILAQNLKKALTHLKDEFEKKEEEFKDIIKLGRTHLQDAVPMTLGQEFSAYKRQMEKGIQRLENTFKDLEELPFGGTAIGTCLAGHKDFGEKACAHLSKLTGFSFYSAKNKFEGISARDSQVNLMGVLNTIATSLMKIATDFRILSSGPRGALGEIYLPELQPGSSIMPGKVNPVMAEMMIQVSAFINGKTTSVTIAGQHAPLQLNMMIPLIGHETLESLEVLTNAVNNFADKAVSGVKADKDRCEEWIQWSLALVTPLKNVIGYMKAAELAHKTFHSPVKKTIKQVVQEAVDNGEIDLKGKNLDEVLDPRGMV